MMHQYKEFRSQHLGIKSRKKLHPLNTQLSNYHYHQQSHKLQAISGFTLIFAFPPCVLEKKNFTIRAICEFEDDEETFVDN